MLELKNKLYDKLVFIHLTKTAGGTLKSEVGRQSDINPLFVYDKDDWGKYDDSTHDVIYGHPDTWLFGNVGKEIPGVSGRIKYIAFLRHPILRTISHYYHLRNHDEGPVGKKIRQFPDINVFFNESYHWEFENYFCRILSNHENVTSNDNMESKFLSAMDILGGDRVFVGFQEFFDYSLQRLNHEIGFKLAPDKNINIGGYSLFDVSDETIGLIKRLNHFDLRLYKTALSDFLDEMD